MPHRHNSLDDVWKYVDRSGGPESCWTWKGHRTHNGYGRMRMKMKKVFVHRFVLESVVGLLPDGVLALHTCDNPACCNPKHLYAGTHQQNMDDMKARHRSVKGERNCRAKVNEESVIV